VLRVAAASSVIAREAVIQAPFAVSFFLKSAKGSRRKGNRIQPEAAPETVSLKTTVIW
jgi:hypothetical protein